MSGLTDDQVSIVELADGAFARRTSNERLAEIEQSAARVDEELWRDVVAAGLTTLGVPEEFGGAGLGVEEELLVVEAQGRYLAPLPLVETVVAARVLAEFGDDVQRKRWLPGVCDGAVLAPAGDGGTLRWDGSTLTGDIGPVPQAHLASGLLLPAVTASGERALFLLDAELVRRADVTLTDHSLAGDLQLDHVSAEPLGAGALHRARRLSRLALAAQLLGVADAGVREAARYVSEREQFGRPLATFQAVSQQLGDAYCDVQAMRVTCWQAAWSVEHDAANADRAVETAVWWATDAGQRVQHVVQHVHGGMGADTTYPVHRRLLWTLRASALLGGPSAALAALAPAVLRDQLLA